MASSFLLELDTTPPVVSIVAPNYTIPNIETKIVINSNEILATYQDFYVLDSNGIRHNVIFEYKKDSFLGVIDFWNFPIGIATIYARVRDEVYNLSEVDIATINVKEAAQIFITISSNTRKIEATESQMALMITEKQRKIEIEDISREVILNDITRRIGVEIG